MNAMTVVGYTYDGEFYCSKDCLPQRTDPDERGTVFAGDEWDYYPTCGTCGEVCEDVTLLSNDD